MNHTVHCQCTPQDVANDIHIFSSVGRAISECVAGLLRASVGPYPECDSHLYLQPMLAAPLLGDSQFERCFAKKSHASCFHPGVFTVNKNRDLIFILPEKHADRVVFSPTTFTDRTGQPERQYLEYIRYSCLFGLGLLP